MRSSLIHFVAYGAQNTYFPITHGVETATIPLQTGSNTIPHGADKVKFNHIAFTATNDETRNMSIDEFKNATRNTIIDITIGGTSINEYKFDLLFELHPVTKFGNTFCVKLPSSYTLPEFYYISLQVHDIVVRILPENNNIGFDMELYVDWIQLDGDERRRLAQNGHERHIQCIEKIGGFHDSVQHTRVDLYGNNPTKGLFIHGDIADITRMQMQINGNDRFDYNQAMISLYCFRITDKLMYFSFSGQNDYQNMSVESFGASLNMSRIDTVTMNFTFSHRAETRRKIEIYNVCGNILRYMGGMAGMAYGGRGIQLQQRTINTIPPSPNIIHPLQVATATTTVTFTNEFREIEPDKRICPITSDEITTFYCRCLTCNNNFDFDAIYQWVITQRKRNCPMCRSVWTNYVKYSTQHEIPEFEQPIIDVDVDGYLENL
jgi:hypothetical protein